MTKTPTRSKSAAARFLKGADYPASPKDLFATAVRNKADNNSLGVISCLPDLNFESSDDVIEALAKIEKPTKTQPKKRGRPKVVRHAHNGSTTNAERAGRCLISESHLREVIQKWERGELKASPV